MSTMSLNADLFRELKQGGTDYEYNEFECRFISGA